MTRHAGVVMFFVVFTWMVPAQELQNTDPRVSQHLAARRPKSAWAFFRPSRSIQGAGERAARAGNWHHAGACIAAGYWRGHRRCRSYPTPPQVVQCVKTGGCDLGFMLIDPARAAEVDFTPAFVRSDFTYLSPALPSATQQTSMRPGIRIAGCARPRVHTAALLFQIVERSGSLYSPTNTSRHSSFCGVDAQMRSHKSARCFCNIRLGYLARACWRIAINQTSLVSSILLQEEHCGPPLLHQRLSRRHEAGRIAPADH